MKPGTRLGPYEILGALGAGGMGEVYRARDTKLNRDVAIKVLPDVFANDPDRLARFTREAQTLATLNHANIAHIHGFEESGGVRALVMELVEGEDLSVLIARGPIPLADALPIARQIADALEAAHEQGIVHRDLKPANVKVRADGTVKVLDFGLAKALDPNQMEPRSFSSGDLANSPTLTGRATQMGMILGTAAYMSPEQARGKAVDRRADIWAFGVVLYEMLTGQRAFKGEEISDVMAAVLRQDIDWTALPAGTPPRLRRLIERCLERDQKTRLRDIGEARVEIARIESGAADTATALSASSPAARRFSVTRVLPWALFAAVGVALVGAVWSWSPWRTAPPISGQVTRFRYVLPGDQQFTRTGRHNVAISPDGSKIAYVANAQLYLRAIDELDAQPIRGTTNEDPVEVVFSPDSQWIAYFAGGTSLRKIAVSGGAPVTLCETEAPWGASWRNGLIAFGQNGRVSGIQAVAETGGTPRMLVTTDASKEIAIQPQLLDDGVNVLFTLVAAGSTGGDRQTVVQRIDGGARTVLVKGGTNARVLPSGQLVYIDNATIFAVPFDAKRLSVTGGPVSVVEGVRETGITFAGQFDISRDGTLAYVPSSADQTLLVLVDRQGGERPIPARPRGYQYPRISPDGARIVMTSGDEENDVWVWDLAKETLTRLTFGPARELYATWMPDSRRVVFGSGNEDSPSIFRRTADGTGAAEPLTRPGAGGQPQSISADGRFLVYRKGLGDLMLLPLEGDRQAKPLLANPRINESNGEISPDGRWLAYQSDESSRSEVYVRPFPAVDESRWQISSDGGASPMWARSGRELFFVAGESPRRMMSISIEAGAAFNSGKPRPMWDATPYIFATGRNFDVAGDGRFLMLKNSAAGARQTSIAVVTHWFDALRARMKK